MIVDAHMHVWRPVRDGRQISETIVDAGCDVPASLAVTYLDDHGVDRGVLVQPVDSGGDNSYVADSAAEQPERFAAVCVVDPRTADAADRLAYWVEERGCRGLRLRPRIPQETAVFGDASTFSLWEYAARRKLAVNLLAGPEHLKTVESIAERFPGVPILLDHMAHPSLEEGVDGASFQQLLRLAGYPRVFVKLSGLYHFAGDVVSPLSCIDLIRALCDRFGPERLIWGSDFPHVLLKSGYRRSLQWIERELTWIGADHLRLILGGNAMQLYWPAET